MAGLKPPINCSCYSEASSLMCENKMLFKWPFLYRVYWTLFFKKKCKYIFDKPYLSKTKSVCVLTDSKILSWPLKGLSSQKPIWKVENATRRSLKCFLRIILLEIPFQSGLHLIPLNCVSGMELANLRGNFPKNFSAIFS